MHLAKLRMDDHLVDLNHDLGKLETEVLQNDPTSIAELRLLTQVACDQYLHGRAEFFLLRLMRGVLRLV